MASSILHITNGDSTTNLLKKLSYEGKIITWREMLCEGKTTIDVGSESFWKNRYEYFKSAYKVSKQKFIDLTVREYRNLCNQKQQDEIVLWFEYDLFCQVNMLAVISWLKRYRNERKISLVCSGEIEGSEKLLGLNELTEEQIQNHYNNRIELTKDDIEHADYIWQLYCSDSPLQLETAYSLNKKSPFIYLENAIKAHLQRFPSTHNGLNQVENFIINTSYNFNPENKQALVKELLKNQEVYGFGDVQYFRKIDRLKNLFTSFNPVKLNDIGKKVLDNQMNYYGQIRSDFSYLGGAKKYSYLYVNATDKLLKITT